MEEKNKENQNVPYILFEATQARNERTVKRLIISLIIVTILMFGSNIAWLYCWSQYDYSSEESVVDLDSRFGNANYIGERGDIYNGENPSR